MPTGLNKIFKINFKKKIKIKQEQLQGEGAAFWACPSNYRKE